MKLKNFLSFRELNHNFIDSPTLIQGRNLTDESQESNGSGKSTIEAGIAYALLATPLRKQIDRELIMWGEEQAEVELSIWCAVRRSTLTVHRVIRSRGSSILEIFLNDEPVKVATILDGNRYILDWLAISAEDLKSFYILNKENYRSFISASNTDKLALINRFIKVDGLDRADDIVKRASFPYEARVHECTKNYLLLEGELNGWRNQLEEERNRDVNEELAGKIRLLEEKCSENVRTIELLQGEGAAIGEQISCSRQTLSTMEQQCASLQRAYEQVAGDNSLDGELAVLNEKDSEYRQAIADAQTMKREGEQAMDVLNAEIARMQVLLSGAVKCPRCGWEFSTTSDKPLEQIQEEIAQYHQECNEWAVDVHDKNDILNDLNREWAAVTEDRQKFQEKLRLHNDSITDAHTTWMAAQRRLQSIKNDIDRCVAQQEERVKRQAYLEDENESLQEQIQRLRNTKPENRVEELEGVIAVLEKKYAAAKADVDKAQAALLEMQQWGQRFKDFKMQLACEQLKLIQDAANTVLERQRSCLRVSIDGFKVNAKGQVKNEITVLVINEEGEYRSFWSYSGGERARVEFAVIQALQEMINTTNPYGGLNFLMIDEVLEGVDPLGLELFMDSLSDVSYPVYIISHTMNIKTNVSTLTVIKENGVSRIE